jgi:hypothetical protein
MVFVGSPQGAFVTRGMRQAFGLGAFLFTSLALIFVFPAPVFGPLIGIAIGCAAITIAIQQSP